MNCAHCGTDDNDGRWFVQRFYQHWVCSVCLIQNANDCTPTQEDKEEETRL